MNRLQFIDYLRAQAHRDDPVGDLARDVSNEKRRYGVMGLRERLLLCAACDGAHRALFRAEQEWREARRNQSA
jgi:hypothetical protein